MPRLLLLGNGWVPVFTPPIRRGNAFEERTPSWLLPGYSLRWKLRVLAWLTAVFWLLGTAAATEVTLAWDPSPDVNVTNYRVYWGYQSRTYTGSFDVGNVTATTVGWLLPGTRYFFAVTATTPEGLESDYSNEVGYTVPLPPPEPPLLEVQVGTSPSEAQLAWTPCPDPALSHYRVYWGTQSRNYTGSFNAGNVTTATIGALTPGSTYYFAVVAMTADGRSSAFSNEKSYTVPLPPPAPPVLELLAGPLAMRAETAAATVRLVWTPSPSPDVVNYRVYWGTQSRNYAGSFDAGNVTSATVSGLEEGVTYYFAVVAVTADGRTSPYSNEEHYTVPLPPPPPPPAEPPVLAEVVSRLTHRDTGPFDLPLNLTGPATVEGRITSSLLLVFRFDKPIVTASAAVAAGVGNISGVPVIEGNEVTVALTSVANRQWLTVRLTGIQAADGATLDEAVVTLGVLGGDVDGNGVINNTDVQVVRAVLGQRVSERNFRADVNSSGMLTQADFQVVRMRVGHRVPAR